LANTVHHPGTPDVTGMIIVGAQDIPEWLGAIDEFRLLTGYSAQKKSGLLYEL
jgi:hypothetical protein